MNRATRCVVASVGLFTFFTFVAHAGVLRVVVHDARNRAPLPGAFVQVGPAPGSPFAGNSGTTAADGSIVFNDSALVGPQTVTAGAAGFSLLTVIEAASDSISLPLHAATIGGTIQGPKAEISGTTVGIQPHSNDGNVDVGVVYPALQLSDVLGRRTAPVEIPTDHVSFPVVGAKDMPGNIVIPRQTEYLVYRFEKPDYHFFVPDADTYDVVVLAGRAPVSSLGSASLNGVTTYRVGIERQVVVNGNLSLTPACDLDLSPSIVVRVPEAPVGTAVEAVSVADIPEPGGPLTLLYDLKSSMAQDLDHFTLSGIDPIGDLSTSVPYVAARFHDPATPPAYEAGRVDRTPLTLPATRSVEGFFLVPDLTQNGGQFTWTQVGKPGITTDPTWAIANFRLEPGSRMLWEVWSPAGRGSFALPALAPGAPGGLPDSTGQDRLMWDQLVADPTGSIQGVLEDPFATLTRYSRRSMEITPPALLAPLAVATLEPGPIRPIALAPQPTRGEVDIVWARPPQPGDEVRWNLVDVSGRRVNAGRFRALGTARERAPWSGGLAPAPGVYWLDLELSGRREQARLVVVR